VIALDRMSDLWGWVTNWNWGTVPDWLMALVTGCAVYVAYRTLNYIKQQADSNEAAAHAAKQSAAEALRAADSLIASERAHVFGKVELVSPFVPYMDKGEMQAFARTLFINHGKTTAIIVNMSGDAYLADKEPEKLNPSPDDARRLPEGWVIASEEKFQHPIELRFTSRQVKDIETRTQTLYCAGHIRYKDILGHEWITGYCWQWVPAQNRFSFCTGSPLNYLRFVR
jgi:hypothetical protein